VSSQQNTKISESFSQIAPFSLTVDAQHIPETSLFQAINCTGTDHYYRP